MQSDFQRRREQFDRDFNRTRVLVIGVFLICIGAFLVVGGTYGYLLYQVISDPKAIARGVGEIAREVERGYNGQ